MNRIFEILAEAGIDGSDPAEIQSFLEQVKAQTPELYETFANAISSIMSENEQEQMGGIENTQSF